MKALFHDEEDGNPEPVAGLPEALPEDERIIWQGAPNGLALTVEALRLRLVAIYFGVFTAWRLAFAASQNSAPADLVAIAATSAIMLFIGAAILMGLGVLMARSTIYTITNKRIVLRYGVGIRKYINIPYTVIETVRLKAKSPQSGSIALATTNESRVPYLHLWPHARPLRFKKPEPMLRAIDNAEDVAVLLCETMQANAPASVRVKMLTPQPAAPTGAAGEAISAA